MTILAALNAHYGRLEARGAVAPFGFSTEGVSFAIVLTPDGEPVSRLDLRNLSGRKPVAASLAVPRSFKRPGTLPRAFFLWDNSKYVLGLGAAKGAAGVAAYPEHVRAFRALHEGLIGNDGDEGLCAVLRFVRAWTPERFAEPPFAPDMLDQNLVFHLDGDRVGGKRRFVHDRPAARAIWEAQVAAGEARSAMCLVTGRVAPVARLHPTIKGVREAQSSGASLVSFNLDAFTSLGKEQGDNAPVSEVAASNYGAALNALLARGSRNRVQIGDATTVFWADASACGEERAARAEALVAGALAPPGPHDPGADGEETRKLREALELMAEGRAVRGIDPDLDPGTRFHILGLAPNAARLSVRFWHETTLGPLVERLTEHWADLAIEPPAWKGPPSVWALLYPVAAQEKAENIPPLLGGEVMRAILTGDRYPRTLLAAVIQRLRAGEPVNGARAALCRAVIQRDLRKRPAQDGCADTRTANAKTKEEVPVALDRAQTNAAYRMGRLFAVLENVQRSALGRVNASIRDRYFGAASATPASVFPLLLRGSTHHLSVLRKNSSTGGLAVWFEREIGEIMDGLPMDLPRHLTLEDQGRFAVGYYHQRNARKSADDAGTPATDRPADSPDEE